MSIFGILLPLALLYVLAAPATLPDYDSGEFAIVAAKGGIVHPPGYPLLCLLLRFASLFQDYFNLIFLLSLVSVICTFAAAILIYGILYEYTENHAASGLGVYGTFLSCAVWRTATSPEPFALNLLLAAVCLHSLWKIVRSSGLPDENHKWFAVSGLAFGLGFCNHHSLAFLLPFAILVWTSRKTGKMRCLLWFSIGSLAGLIPLLYFFSDFAQGPYVWGNWADPFKRILTHLFRREYGTTSLLLNSHGMWYSGVILFLNTLPKHLSAVFFVFALAGILLSQRVAAEKKQSFPQNSLFHAGIGLSILFTGGIFIAMFRIGPSDWEKSIAERFFALPVMLLAFPISVFSLKFQEIWQKKNLQALLTVTVILFHGVWQWPCSERATETFYETHIRNVLHTVEKNAVVVSATDSNYFGILYSQHVLGLRPDVAVFQVELWHSDWYPGQFLKTVGLPAHPSYENPAAILSRLMKERPVYILDKQEEVNSLLRNAYPLGPLLRLTGENESVPSPYELYAINLKLFTDKMNMQEMDRKAYFNIWENGLIPYYQRTWKIMADTFAAYGDRKMEAVCRKYEFFFETSK